MILKRNFHPLRVLRYVQWEVLVALLASTSAYSWALWGKPWALPLAVSATLGSALAIFIAFRNNSSYARWWEARTLWGGIVNSTRVLARLVITFADSHSHQPGYFAERSHQFKRKMVYQVVAWSHALRLHLRKEESWDELKPFLSDEEFHELLQNHNKPNGLQMIMGRTIYQAMADGTLGGFDSFQMEGQLLALANYQGGCERIKNTPLLRQYDFFTRVFLFAFVVLLPFTLVAEFERMQVIPLLMPVSLLIALVFAIMGKVGQVNEDPFENRITDVPMTALCNTIERDLRFMLDEKQLPASLTPINGYLH
jgi:putative membrane protein